MVYFLGRDVSVAISTESANASDDIGVKANYCARAAETLDAVFAADMNGKTTFAGFTAGDGLVEGLTGMDISVGANDEDITFVGQRTTGKTEIKKEISVTLTRKKQDNVWQTIFNGPCTGAALENFTSATLQARGARWGGDDTSDTFYIGDGNSNPKTVRAGAGSANIGYGYRLHVQLKSGAAGSGSESTFAIPNCTLTGYTLSASPDGVDEESMEFMTQMAVQNADTGDAIYTTLTTAGEF